MRSMRACQVNSPIQPSMILTMAPMSVSVRFGARLRLSTIISRILEEIPCQFEDRFAPRLWRGQVDAAFGRGDAEPRRASGSADPNDAAVRQVRILQDRQQRFQPAHSLHLRLDPTVGTPDLR